MDVGCWGERVLGVECWVMMGWVLGVECWVLMFGRVLIHFVVIINTQHSTSNTHHSTPIPHLLLL